MMSSISIKIPSNNPNTYCRLCFSNRNLVPLSPNDAEPQSILLEQISQYIGIQINPVADLPCSICWRCAVALEDFQIFRQRSLQHDAVLRELRPIAFNIEESQNQKCIKDEEKNNCVPTPPDDADSSSSYNQTEDSLFMDQSSVLSNTLYESTEFDASDISSQSNAKIFTCHLCKTKFSTQATLFAHFKEQHSDRGRPFKCSYCPAAFKRKNHVANHMSSHTGEMRYSCKDCGAQYAKAKSLIRHRQQYHAVAVVQPVKIPKIVGQFKCAYCPKSFKHRPSLNFHVKSHYDMLPHVCEICDARFENMKGKLVHRGKYHSEETTKKSASPKEVFECAHCPRIFEQQRYLTQHIKYIHPGYTVSWSECDETQYENQNLETQDFVGPDQTIDESEPVIIKTEIDDSDPQDEFGMQFS